MSFQRVQIIGNVGRIDIRTIDQGGQQVKVASFSMATSEKYTDRNGQTHENTEWHSLVCWRKQAELIEKYVSKGDRLFVEGKLRTRKYTTQNNEERTVTEIVVDTMQFLGKKQEKNDSPQMPSPEPQEDSAGDLPF